MKTAPLIEGKLSKPAARLCKSCPPVDWIKCYQTNGKWKQCDKQAAKQP
jgi:hypothetical protein